MTREKTKDKPAALSQVDKLSIAGQVAPLIRGRTKAPRRITVVDKTGKPVRVTDDVQLAKDVLARSEIEFSVQDGVRPTFVNCETCGRPIKVAKKGRVPTICQPQTHRCACGSRLRVTGKCEFGLECKKCLGAKRLRAIAGLGASYIRLVSDEQIIEAVKMSPSYLAAAELLGMSATTILTRAVKLGVVPNEAARKESNKKRCAAMRAHKGKSGSLRGKRKKGGESANKT